MSIDDALNAMNDAIQEANASQITIPGTGIELPLGFNGYVAPAHPGMELSNVQETEPLPPVHIPERAPSLMDNALSGDSGGSLGDVMGEVMGEAMSSESSASTTVVEDMSGNIADETA